MKEKISLENLFRDEALFFGVKQAAEECFQEVIKGKELEQRQNAITDRQAKLSWLIKQAQENLSMMLHTGGKEFDGYMQALFKVHARSYLDSSGVCGFKVPTPKWKKTGGKDLQQILGQKVPGQTRELVGTFDDYHIDVSVLELYTEKIIEEAPRNTFSMEERIGMPTKAYDRQVLALVSMASGSFPEPTLEQIRKSKLVHLTCTTRSNPPELDYSDAKPVSLDQEFIDTLLELVLPETTLQLLFMEFGTKNAKKPGY